MTNLNPNKMMFRADIETRHSPIKKIQGKEVVHVATQVSRRTKKKRTVYVYNIEGTNIIVYNRSLNATRFMKIAIRPQNVQRFYETFVKEPLTPKEKQWLDLYGYVLTR